MSHALMEAEKASTAKAAEGTAPNSLHDQLKEKKRNEVKKLEIDVANETSDDEAAGDNEAAKAEAEAEKARKIEEEKERQLKEAEEEAERLRKEEEEKER